MAELKPLEAAVSAMSDLPLRRFGRPVGRDDLLRALLLRLRQSQPLVLHGASGIGKTTIAATIANVYVQQAQQSVLWLPVEQASLAELLVRIGRAYGATDISNAANPLKQLSAVAGLLRQNQPLLVLDGEIDESVLTQFYDRCAQDIPLVVTNAKALPGGDWRNQAIGNLAEDDALQLFKQKAGLKDDQFDSDAASIATKYNNEAFPLVLAARSMIITRQSPDEYDAALDSLLEAAGNDGVTAALTASVGALNPRLSDLLESLAATARGEASIAFMSMLFDMTASAVDQSMTILSRLFLVERYQRNEEACYRLHPLAQEYLQNRSRENDKLAALQDDVKSTVLAYLDAHASADDATARMMIEMDNFVAIASCAADDDDHELAGTIAAALSENEEMIEGAGYAYELALLQAISEGRTLDFAEEDDEDEAADATEIDDVTGEAQAADPDEADDTESADEDDPQTPSADDSTFIPIADEELQSVNIDQLRTALNVASENNETARQLQILKAIAKVQVNQGREPEAVATYGQVLEIYESGADKDGVLETLDMLAGLLISSEGTPAAIEQVNLRTALTLARQHEDTPRVLEILNAIGKIQIDQNRAQDAVATYGEVLEIHDAKENKAGILETLDMLAGLLVRSGAAVTALHHIQRALHLTAELNDQDSEMFLRISLGDAHRALGESVTAVEAYELALTIARHRDDQQNEAQILFKLGLAQLDAGDGRQAIEMLESANELFKSQSNRAMEGQVLQGLGAVNVNLERWSEAVNFHSSALYIAREVQDRNEEAQQLRVLGKVLIKANRLPEALTRYRQALHVAYEEGKTNDIVLVIADLVNLMMRNLFLASIAELLINDGLTYDDDDRELLRLKGEVNTAKEKAAAKGVTLAVVAGTAKEYAANAYNYN